MKPILFASEVNEHGHMAIWIKFLKTRKVSLTLANTWLHYFGQQVTPLLWPARDSLTLASTWLPYSGQHVTPILWPARDSRTLASTPIKSYSSVSGGL